MEIWSLEEFNKFISSKDNYKSIAMTGFNILFWCRLKTGELLALTKEDINFEKKTLRRNKSYQWLKGKDIITTPKTPKSNRVIEIDDNLISI